MSLICKFCGRKFDYNNGQQLSGHILNCRENPQRNLIKQKRCKSIHIKYKKLYKRYKIYCLKCGKSIPQLLTESSFRRKKYRKCCSMWCAHSHIQLAEQNKIRSEKLKGRYIKRIICKCEICNKEFECIPCKKTKTCGSKECKSKLFSKLFDKSPGSNKYKWIKINGRVVREHTYLIEQKIGRRLNKNECVHHKNGIRYDNRDENLELLLRSNHTNNKKAERIKLNCPVCNKEILIRKRLYLLKIKEGQKQFFCSKGCFYKRDFSQYNYKKFNISKCGIIKKELNKNLNGNEIARKYNWCRKTVYNYINRIKNYID